MIDQKKILCRKCRHYYITWDEKFPHGCRAMAFKGKTLPSAVVLKNSGTPCYLFEKKAQKKKTI